VGQGNLVHLQKMETRIFDRNETTGITRLWHYNPETDEATIETQQDVSNVVEENKDQFNATDNKANWTGEWHKVASIPLNIYYELQASGKITDQAYMRRWLNDPDNRFFRTRPGQV